ncbi:ankyrin repeat domain-containing protein [Candidatus Tisiphia endosymbiont of Beris chalybata]|uniref:ankyrin repeat domain-containing protein n=1 Tax=Candidatus Tisiphia endosymbiont of Beris chalybata TaxID=3066262 RepID=UPI00312C7C53
MLTNSIFRLNDTKLQEAISYIISQGQNPAYALEVAEILLTIYPNNNTVIAGLLSTAISTTDLSKITLPLQQISSQFGIEIANIVEGILKTSTIHYLPYNIRQAQKFFDFLLSMPQEVAVGVLFVKLAHLLHNISIFSVNPTLEKYAISALEIIEIYVPLMSRVGFEAIKIELQEICLTILQPDIREYILTHLYAFCGKDIKALITKIINSLHNSLQAEGIQAKIFGRIKTPYSIWLKMLQKNINIGQLYDILAFRIIVENVEDCYKALAVMHAHYQSVKGQFQDYIHRPKSNGYQSLHTIIIGPTRQNIEIQIRTCAMNEKAQHGTAAHWKYKKKPAIIKEKVYNIYQSLYQSAYLPLINILKTPAKDRDIKQRIHRLYKFESYKELGILRNINSRLSFNDHATNIYQNNNNTILTLLEPNINSDFNHRLPSPHDMIVSCSVDSISDYPTAQLVMNDLTTFQQTNLLLDTYSAETYLSSDSNSTPHLPPQLMPKTEPLKFQTPPNNPQATQPLLIAPSIYIKKVTLAHQARNESFDYNAIDPLLSAQLTTIIRQTLLRYSQALDNRSVNQPDENDYPPLIKAVISNDKEQVIEILQDQELNPNEGAAFIPVGRTSSNIWSAFLLAVYMREEEIVRAFLSHPKTDITQKKQDNETALILAAQVSNVEAFKVLVNHFKAHWQNIFQNDIKEFREYINWQDHHDKSALSHARQNYLTGATDSTVIVRVLLEWKDLQQTPLISDSEQLVFTIMVLQALGIVCFTLEKDYIMDEKEWGYCPHGLTESYTKNPDNLYQVLEKFRNLREIINLVRASCRSNLEFDSCTSSTDVKSGFHINFTNIININDVDQHGKSLLVNAISCYDINTVKCLLKFPEIDIHQINPTPTIRSIRDDDYPFLLAVQMGNIEIIQAFLAHPKTDITRKDQNHKTALILAAQASNVEAFQLLVNHLKTNWQNIFKNDIKEFREYINWQDPSYNSALFYATEYYLTGENDNPAIIQALLESQDNQPEHIISISEQRNFTTMVLQSLGVVSDIPEEADKRNEEEYENYGLTDSYNKNPGNLYHALEKFRNLREIINLVRASCRSNLEFDSCTSSTDVKNGLHINFTNIININDVDQHGQSLLVNAISCHDINTVKCLLKFPEIDIHQINPTPTIRSIREDDQPFLLAVQMDNIEIIQAFLAHSKTDITVKHQDEKTALILAAQASNVEAFELLVNHFKANWQNIFKNDIKEFKEYINWQDHDGKSALFHARQNYLMGDTDDLTIVEILLKWRGNQQQLLVSKQEQKQFVEGPESDEGYGSAISLNLLEENSLISLQRLYALVQIAVANLDPLITILTNHCIKQVLDKKLMYQAKNPSEVSEYPLIDTDCEEERVKNIGDRDGPMWD